MNYKTIFTEDVVLLIDTMSIIKKDDYWYNVINNEFGISHYNIIPPEWGETYKIIGYRYLKPNHIKIGLPLLPEWEEDDIIKETALNFYPVNIKGDGTTTSTSDYDNGFDVNCDRREGFIEGFKKSQELLGKMGHRIQPTSFIPKFNDNEKHTTIPGSWIF